jgi:hypothetical protein
MGNLAIIGNLSSISPTSPIGSVLRRSECLFCGGNVFDPLVFNRTPFPFPQPHTTFISSHNGGELNPVPQMRPAAILTDPLLVFDIRLDRRSLLGYVLPPNRPRPRCRPSSSISSAKEERWVASSVYAAFSPGNPR